MYSPLSVCEPPRSSEPAYVPPLYVSAAEVHVTDALLSKAFHALLFVPIEDAATMYLPCPSTVVVDPVSAAGGCSDTMANLLEMSPPESMRSPVALSQVTRLLPTAASRKFGAYTLL